MVDEVGKNTESQYGIYTTAITVYIVLTYLVSFKFSRGRF